jgi:hypothetical protein
VKISAKIMGAWCTEGVIGQGVDPASLNQDGVASVLNFAVNRKKRFLGDGKASLFEKLWGNDGVGNAAFIFEAEKDESLSGTRALAADDESCNVSLQKLRFIPVEDVDEVLANTLIEPAPALA